MVSGSDGCDVADKEYEWELVVYADLRDFVICFPLFAKSLQYNKVWIPLLIVSVVCFQPLAKFLRYYSEAGHYVLHYFPLLYSGMIARKFSLFDFLAEKRIWCRLLLVAALLVARFVLGWNILNIGLIIAMIMFLIDIQGYLSDMVKRGFDFFGKMSMNMWLIHLFLSTMVFTLEIHLLIWHGYIWNLLLLLI